MCVCVLCIHTYIDDYLKFKRLFKRNLHFSFFQMFFQTYLHFSSLLKVE